MAPDLADWTPPDAARTATGTAVLVAASALATVGLLGDATSAAGSATGALAGVAVGVAVLVVYLATGTPYAFLVGQVGLVVGLGGGPTTTPGVQALLVAPLVLDASLDRDPGDRVATFLVAIVAAVSLFAILAYTAGTLVAGILLLAVTGLAVYTIHRYERLALELVGDAS